MSNIYIQEPLTNGKVLLKTTIGDIDIELWSKETPKACYNFLQLCMEGYYNETIFHRIVKGFIVQGGDPTGTGNGGESVYGNTFKDEFHSRLRFNRRGLVAMANAGRDDNASQFFFTLAATPELQNKHTIFGKVTGETVFNILKLEDALVDKDERPLYPQKIIRTEILSNPFPDMVPRRVTTEQTEVRHKKSKENRVGVKNFKLLSFGEEAEEDEEETNEANRKFSGRSKSTHDILNDPHLSAVPAIETANKSKLEGNSDESDLALSEDEDLSTGNNLSSKESDEINAIRKKLKTEKGPIIKSVKQHEKEDCSDNERHNETSDDERHSEKHKKVEDIRKEIRDLKRELNDENKRKENANQEEIIERKTEDMKTETLKTYKHELEKYKQLKESIPKKGSSREDFTLTLLAKFQKKLASAKEKAQENSEVEKQSNKMSDKPGEDVGDGAEVEDWLTHELKFDANAPVLAKDASTKSDNWFEIYDPRNPINKRRRETSKDIMKHTEKR